MIADRWQRLNEVFHSAIALSAEERDAFLAAACADDPALRGEVERLIAAHGHAGGFIEAPALASVAAWTDGDGDLAAAGRRFGAYRVVREIGRGGMGAVFLAERADGQFDQRVAVKLIKRGMDTELVLRRFRAERQILASLEHPNIARLLDGGTTDDGLPYFVMEYIDGQPIDRYADERRLTVAERLQLFLQVCDAVAYAHQHLVVHRDIKPLNILVTPGGVPKLLDFGIAKVLLTDASDEPATVTGFRLLTPEYASPEQVDGRPATTASDVYSLGVVLYELLTGRSPYRPRSRTPLDVAESVRTTEPERPSTAVTRVGDGAESGRGAGVALDRAEVTRMSSTGKLQRRLRGDVDTLVLTALRKEPARRYASVEQFAGDIRRHLEGRPVQARADTAWYRGSKFVRRNRVAVTAGALVALALVGGTVATAWQAREARAQARLAQAAQARAERRFNDVRTLANKVLFDYHDAIKDLEGATPVRERLVRDALQYLDTLAREAQGDPSLQRELASAYRRVGDVQGGTAGATLGDTEGAIASYRKALGILEALLRSDPADVETRRAVASVATALGGLLWETGDLTGGLQHAERARTLLERLAAASLADPELRYGLSAAYDLLGGLSLDAGKAQAALEFHRKHLRLLESAPDSERQTPRLRRSVSIAHHHLGDVEVQLGDLPAALESHRRALALRRALLAEFPDNADYYRLVGASLYYEAEILAEMGRTREALARYRQLFAEASASAAADPKNAQYRSAMAFDLTRIGDMLVRLGDHEQALGEYRRSLDIRKPELRADPTNLLKRLALIESHARLCKTLASVGRPSARAACAETASLMDKTVIEPTDAGDRGYIAGAYSDLGEVYETLAASRATPPADRRDYWRAARGLHQRSLSIWSDLTARGAVVPADTGRLGAAERAVARCDAALREPLSR